MWSPGKQGSEGFDLFIWIKNRKINQQAAKSSTWKKIQPPSSKNTTSLPPPKIQPPSPKNEVCLISGFHFTLLFCCPHGSKFTSCHMIRLTFCHMTYCWLALWCIVLGKVGRSSNLSYSRWNSFGTLLQFCTSKK